MMRQIMACSFEYDKVGYNVNNDENGMTEKSGEWNVNLWPLTNK